MLSKGDTVILFSFCFRRHSYDRMDSWVIIGDWNRAQQKECDAWLARRHQLLDMKNEFPDDYSRWVVEHDDLRVAMRNTRIGARINATHAEIERMTPHQRMDHEWLPQWLLPGFNFDDGTPAGGATSL